MLRHPTVCLLSRHSSVIVLYTDACGDERVWVFLLTADKGRIVKFNGYINPIIDNVEPIRSNELYICCIFMLFNQSQG